MILIDKEKTIHDLVTVLHRYGSNLDTRIFFGALGAVDNQKAVLNFHGDVRYGGAVLGPCPKCGSFEVEVNARRISDPDSTYFNQFEGRFHCLTCGKEFEVRASCMPYIFTEWNRFCTEEIKRKVANNGESKMH